MKKTFRAAAAAAALMACAPAHAQTPPQADCRPASAQPARKPSALGGLFAAARDAGLAQALVTGLGPAESQAASALLSGDAAGAATAAASGRDPRTAQLAGALAGAAVNMARSARASGAGACAPAAVEPAPSVETW